MPERAPKSHHTPVAAVSTMTMVNGSAFFMQTSIIPQFFTLGNGLTLRAVVDVVRTESSKHIDEFNEVILMINALKKQLPLTETVVHSAKALPALQATEDTRSSSPPPDPQ